MVVLDQLSRLLHGLRRAVGIVVTDEVDLAAVNAAFVVDHTEVGRFGLADGAVGRCWPTIGHDVADFDGGVGGAGIIL